MTEILPYLTAELPGAPGEIKQSPEDFIVDELPLYPACGQGDHLYFRLHKRGLSTYDAVAMLANALKIPPSVISTAGLKDTQAVTSQMVSIEHLPQSAVERLKLADIWFSEFSHHTNKIKTGHLAGNRFRIKIREVKQADFPKAKAIFDKLIEIGVPNYFGIQRFGLTGENPILGKALIQQNYNKFVNAFLGNPLSEIDSQTDFKQALFRAINQNSIEQFLSNLNHAQKNLLHQLTIKSSTEKAVKSLDKKLLRLLISSFQSKVFNQILAKRIDSLNRLLPGDWAQKHSTGGAFIVEDPTAEQPRCDSFEISPAGLLPGYRMDFAQQEPGKIEMQSLENTGLKLEDFRPSKQKGTRRALRYQLMMPQISAGSDEAGDFFEICFAAPAGSYATVLLEEITKTRKPYWQD